MVAGIFTIHENLRVAAGAIVFFGGCASVFAGAILRKLRYRKESRAINVDIKGGVPIRPSRKRVLVMGLAIILSGSILLYFGDPYPLPYLLFSFVWVAMGAVLLLGVVIGILPFGFIQFDPCGLTIGQRLWNLTIPWDHIPCVAPGEQNDNVTLLIWISEIEAVVVRPEKYREKALKKLESNMLWVGVPVTIMASQYCLSLPLLIKVIERYITVPSSRKALER